MIRGILGDELTESIKAMKSKEDNISVFIQLFERVNQQEALIAQYFSKMQKELGAQN